ncbi:MAG: amino acid ABC transporter substrate-binding protein [Moraxellaceae bacterium]|nr:amino acid ABC transporter substrate-binding protein [Moraxellaceae bacterium]
MSHLWGKTGPGTGLRSQPVIRHGLPRCQTVTRQQAEAREEALPVRSALFRLVCLGLAIMMALLSLPGQAQGNATTSAAPSGEDTLARIKRTGTLVMGFRADARPFSFKGVDGQAAGYSVDLCKAVAVALAERLRLPQLKTRWQAVTPADRVEQVRKGSIDLECGTTTRTLAREAQVDFSHTIFVDGLSLMSLAGSQFSRPADIQGKRIGVVAGTTGANRIGPALAAAGVNAQLVTLTDYRDGINAIDAGKVDLLAGDRGILVGTALDAPGRAYSLMQDMFSVEPYALMMARDAAFRYEVNRALSRFYRSGEVLTTYNHWMQPYGEPTKLMSAAFQLYALPD